MYDPKLTDYKANIVSFEKKFIVNYNELIKMLQQLGYKISSANYQDFNSARRTMSVRREPPVCKVDIDFRKPPQIKALKP